MKSEAIENANAGEQTDSEPQWQRVSVAVPFDVCAVAAALGVSCETLQRLMLQVTANALTRDAVEMAAEAMRLEGRVFSRDGYPPGWPLEHLAAVTRYRLLDRGTPDGVTQQ